jgi:hypothetical protein
LVLIPTKKKSTVCNDSVAKLVIEINLLFLSKVTEQDITVAKEAFLQAGNEALNTLKDTNQEMEFALLQAVRIKFVS